MTLDPPTQLLRNRFRPILARGFDSVGRWYRERADEEPSRKWIYRGLADDSFGLLSTLDREVVARDWGRSKRDLETGLFRHFVRHFHLFERGAAPDEGSVLEWLALMRHFGAPTRLVDFSYSFWVAVFFAVCDLPDKDAEVWAVDEDWLKDRATKKLEQSGAKAELEKRDTDLHAREWSNFGGIYNREPAVPFVLKQSAWRQNERVVAQQGVFLCPGDVEQSFSENLSAMVDSVGRHPIVRLQIPSSIKAKTLAELRRQGITRATMYPHELEHYAKSLADLMVEPDVLAPKGVGCVPLGTGKRLV